MRKIIKIVYWWLVQFGVDPYKTLHAVIEMPVYIKNYILIKRQAGNWRLSSNKPCLHDRADSSGQAKGHYFFQDLYYAKKIFHKQPVKHVDVGSRVDGFVAHVASFRDIEVLDIRPNNSLVDGITFKQCDFTKVTEEFVECTDSLSCLHALEHFGLGRYGDALDIDGYIDGAQNIKKILKPGGVLYLSVPIGRERIEFDAHRVFYPETIISLFFDFDLVDFAWVSDDGNLHSEDVKGLSFSQFNNLDYGLGMFTFEKK